MFELLAGLAGVLTWTLLEYVLHRWAGHVYRRNVFGVEHTRHHSEGDYFAPTWKKAMAGTALALILIGPAGLLLGWSVGLSYVAGLVGFYLVYEWLHRREHTHGPATAYGRWARRHHFWHHFGNPKVNHGVTSPLWDWVFGTYHAPELIRVPQKLCMVWLRDPATGEVWPEHASGYAVRGRRA